MHETYVIGFDSYPSAREAVDAILKEGFREEDVNVIVQDKIVKGATDVDWRTVRAEKSERLGSPLTRGLDAIDSGKAIVAGEPFRGRMAPRASSAPPDRGRVASRTRRD